MMTFINSWPVDRLLWPRFLLMTWRHIHVKPGHQTSTKEVFSPLSSLLLSNLSFSETTNSTLSLINIFEKWIHNSWSSWPRDKLINILHQQFHVWTLTILTHSLVLPRCEIISGVLLPVHNTTLFANVTRYLLWEDLSASVVPSKIQRQWIKHQLTIGPSETITFYLHSHIIFPGPPELRSTW